jgi:uncharacterized protein (TIGR00251 family)
VIEFIEDEKSLTFNVRVVPRASRSAVAGEHDGALKIRIAAPPFDNAANEELCRYLAEIFHVPNRAVEIIAGRTAKTKRVRVNGATRDSLSKLAAKN